MLATEALVRWQHPTRGLLSPDLFIGVAESINLAGELGRWVMRTACAEFARWRSRGVGLDTVLRINVSPVQLVTDGFVESVAGIINEFGLDGGSVCLEITESVVVQDIETTRITLAGLKQVGVQVAIDDFGTGYSVLSLLKSLPVDTLKIDKGFVRELGSNPGDLAIVRAIIALAEAFGLQLVAEGVETGLQRTTLLRHGCYRAQGFLLSRPVAAGVMESLLAQGRIPVDFSAAPGCEGADSPRASRCAAGDTSDIGWVAARWSLVSSSIRPNRLAVRLTRHNRTVAWLPSNSCRITVWTSDSPGATETPCRARTA